MRALSIAFLLVLGAPAHAEPDLCASGRYRGAPIDLDVKGADVHDVYRLLANVGRVNVVVSDEVRANVTLALKRVPWDQVACTVAAMYRLRLERNGNVIMVVPKSR